MITWGSSGLLLFDIIEGKTNHANALVVDGAGTEGVDDLRGVLDLLDLSVGTDISALDDLFAVLAVECHLEDVEVAVIESNAGEMIIIFEFVSLGGGGILFTPFGSRGAIRKVELDRLKGWLLELIGHSGPLDFLQA